MPISSAATLNVERLGRGFAWLDTGTPDSLLEAASYRRRHREAPGTEDRRPEEIAFRQGFIDAEALERLIAERYAKNDYGRYLTGLLRERS